MIKITGDQRISTVDVIEDGNGRLEGTVPISVEKAGTRQRVAIEQANRNVGNSIKVKVSHGYRSRGLSK